MLRVDIKITGDTRIQTKLKRLGSSLYNFTDAMKEIGKESVKYFSNDPFLTQGRSFGATWQRLSPKYQARKSKLYPGRPIMVGSGGLSKSFVALTTPQSATITNDTSYFKYHQSTAARKVMPRRQLIGVNKHIRTLARDVIQKDIEKKLRTV